MSKQIELNCYIRQLRQRLRLGTTLRGAAILTASALAATVAIVLILNAYAFPEHGLLKARAALFVLLAIVLSFGLALPLIRLSKRRSVTTAEARSPAFNQRLLTFHERNARQTAATDPFLELLAADTLSVAQQAPPSSLAPAAALFAMSGVALACLGVLVWMIAAGPGYLGYGASLLWTGPKPDVAPLYSIRVTPGDAAVRRNSDQLITAEVVGLQGVPVKLYAHYQGALDQSKTASPKSTGWEPVIMQPQAGASGFQFLFTGLPEDVEYYVQAGRVTSPHFKVRVVDLPAVKQIQVTYHYPKWTGMQPVSEDHGGDLRAIEDTEAEIHVVTDRPLKDGLLMLESGQQLHLTGGQNNTYRGAIHMEKDGAYHIAAAEQGQQVRLSEDFFIATNKATPPEIAIDRPGADYRASPIEEVTIGVRASAEYGLNRVNLHYSVNGGPDRSVSLLKQSGAKNSSGSTTLSLEDFKLVPGDVVSLYATAKDGHAEARTEISFIQADPFERKFSQSQQSGGGGGGGGGGQSNQTDISKREKEVIEATWKQQNNKTATPKENADQGRFLSDVQTKLRDQVLALAGRMESRDLSSANEEFTSFGKDMQAAAAAMGPSSDKLKDQKWQDAIPVEQKALQALLRAEATFRKIQVAFGQQRGGGGGGGGGSAGRDLASLFDLELDTQKNQYESAQTANQSGSGASDQRAKEVDDALQKLDALAHRQEELAQQQQKAASAFQERWQQEMLRREAEQLQRQMEQMANQQGQSGQQSAGNSSSQSSNGKQSASGTKGRSQSGSQSPSQQAAADPRVEQALNRLRQANDAMKRSAGQQQGADAARQAAEQLRQATSLLGGVQQQQASGKLDSLSQEAQRLSKEEQAQADRIRTLAGQPAYSDAQDAASQAQLQSQIAARAQERTRLADDRQRLSDDLGHLEKGLRDSARQLAPTQPGTSSKLRDALSSMDQSDLSNRVQRTADWLRRGINPTSNNTESDISKGLQSLSEQVRKAQQGLGSGQDLGKQGLRNDPGRQTAALDHVDRLRGQLESLTAGRQGNQRGQSGQPGQRGNQPGQQGQPGQPGQGGRPGPGVPSGQASQQGQGEGREGNAQQRSNSQGQGSGQQPGERAGQIAQGGDVGNSARSGDIGNTTPRGGGQGTAWGNVNTGNNRFDQTGQRVINPGPSTPPPGRAYEESMGELNQLRELARNDPAALKEIQELARQMQRLDPNRFPGNPALVEQLHTQMLGAVDKLELQLRRDANDQSLGQIRTSKSTAVPPQYQEAVADYFRSLSKTR